MENVQDKAEDTIQMNTNSIELENENNINVTNYANDPLSLSSGGRSNSNPIGTDYDEMNPRVTSSRTSDSANTDKSQGRFEYEITIIKSESNGGIDDDISIEEFHYDLYRGEELASISDGTEETEKQTHCDGPTEDTGSEDIALVYEGKNSLLNPLLVMVADGAASQHLNLDFVNEMEENISPVLQKISSKENGDVQLIESVDVTIPPDISNEVNKSKTKQTKLFCKRCSGVSFTTQIDLDVHRLCEHVYIFGCAICNSYFTNTDKLKKHQISHKVNGFLICPFCSNEYKSKNLILSHITTIHPKNPRMYGCSTMDCDLIFQNVKDLQAHKNSNQHFQHNSINSKKIDEISWIGKCCEQTFTNYELYKLHFDAEHENVKVILKENEEEATENASVLKKFPKTDKCSVCDLTFLTSAGLFKHKMKHHGIKYICSICNMEFVNKKLWLDHRVENHSELNVVPSKEKCPDCRNIVSENKNKKDSCWLCTQIQNERSEEIESSIMSSLNSLVADSGDSTKIRNSTRIPVNEIGKSNCESSYLVDKTTLVNTTSPEVDEPPKSKKMRIDFQSVENLSKLQHWFANNPNPTDNQIRHYAEDLSPNRSKRYIFKTEVDVKNWFEQARRHRTSTTDSDKMLEGGSKQGLAVSNITTDSNDCVLVNSPDNSTLERTILIENPRGPVSLKSQSNGTRVDHQFCDDVARNHSQCTTNAPIVRSLLNGLIPYEISTDNSSGFNLPPQYNDSFRNYEFDRFRHQSSTLYSQDQPFSLHVTPTYNDIYRARLVRPYGQPQLRIQNDRTFHGPNQIANTNGSSSNYGYVHGSYFERTNPSSHMAQAVSASPSKQASGYTSVPYRPLGALAEFTSRADQCNTHESVPTYYSAQSMIHPANLNPESPNSGNNVESPAHGSPISQMLGCQYQSSQIAPNQNSQRGHLEELFHPEELKQLLHWFSGNPRPSEELIQKYADELNDMPYRRNLPKLNAKLINKWLIRARIASNITRHTNSSGLSTPPSVSSKVSSIDGVVAVDQLEQQQQHDSFRESFLNQANDAVSRNQHRESMHSPQQYNVIDVPNVTVDPTQSIRTTLTSAVIDNDQCSRVSSSLSPTVAVSLRKTSIDKYLEVPKLLKWYEETPTPSQTEVEKYTDELNNSGFRKGGPFLTRIVVSKFFQKLKKNREINPEGVDVQTKVLDSSVQLSTSSKSCTAQLNQNQIELAKISNKSIHKPTCTSANIKNVDSFIKDSRNSQTSLMKPNIIDLDDDLQIVHEKVVQPGLQSELYRTSKPQHSVVNPGAQGNDVLPNQSVSNVAQEANIHRMILNLLIEKPSHSAHQSILDIFRGFPHMIKAYGTLYKNFLDRLKIDDLKLGQIAINASNEESIPGSKSTSTSNHLPFRFGSPENPQSSDTFSKRINPVPPSFDSLSEIPLLEFWFSINPNPDPNFVNFCTRELNQRPYRVNRHDFQLSPIIVESWFKWRERTGTVNTS